MTCYLLLMPHIWPIVLTCIVNLILYVSIQWVNYSLIFRGYLLISQCAFVRTNTLVKFHVSFFESICNIIYYSNKVKDVSLFILIVLSHPSFSYTPTCYYQHHKTRLQRLDSAIDKISRWSGFYSGCFFHLSFHVLEKYNQKHTEDILITSLWGLKLREPLNTILNERFLILSHGWSRSYNKSWR